MRTTTFRFLLLLLAVAGLPASAQPRDSVEGKHYVALAKPQPTEAGADRIEIRELFWYGCNECATLEPLMSDLRDELRGDLMFVRMPAVWNDLMALHARLYYTGRALKIEDRIHQAAFRALQEQGNPLRTEAQIKAFFAANGVAADKFDSAWNSEEVTSAVAKARERTAAYGLGKVPGIVMNGRYLITHNAKVFNDVELNIAVSNMVRKLREERRSDFQ